jgi:trehalose-phosphatase
MTLETTPSELARLVEPLLSNALIAFDVDGVLAPIVERADHAQLTPGVLDALGRLGERSSVAIISGRAIADLERLFAFPPEITVVGSHGLEERGRRPVVLDDDERYTLDQLELLGTKAVEAAGDGAWLEYKPASVVLHVRAADPDLAEPAIEAVTNLAKMISGAQVKPGHMVVELLARSASKGDAIDRLRAARRPVIFFGDDVTDEHAFEIMDPDDISVRVGPGDTAARYRLSGPAAVADFLAEL